MDPKAIIEELTAAGVSQVQIAEAIGMAQSGVSRLQSGERTRISYDAGVKLTALRRRVARKARQQ